MKIPSKYERLEDCSKEDLINKIIVRERHCNDLKELLDKGLKKYGKLKEEKQKFKEISDKYVPMALRLEDENKKLINKLMKLENIWKIIENCVVFAFFCFMCAGMLCMLFEMITDVIMGFQFVRNA